MRKRFILKSQLVDAWKGCVIDDYPNGAINGERALQACLYHRLVNLFAMDHLGERRSIFVEPKIAIQVNDKTHHRMPDLVICDTKNVIAIVELKFHPRAELYMAGRLRGGLEKDLNTLQHIAEDLEAVSKEGTGESSAIRIYIDRYLGEERIKKQTEFGLAKNLLLVWAGFHKKISGDKQFGEGGKRHDPNKLWPHFGNILIQGGFLELHAMTREGEVAELACWDSGRSTRSVST